MINIVVPMAGRGARFLSAGYTLPKPFIEIHGRPMIEYVIRNVTPREEHRFIFLCLQEHIADHGMDRRLRDLVPGCLIVPVDRVTEGAACTVLLAEEYAGGTERLMIANADQYVDYDINAYLRRESGADGLIMTMKSSVPNCSFIRTGQDGFVTIVREKEPISDEATVGIYNFARGSDFVRYAREMIRRDLRVNGEFYVAPVYNLLIEDGKRIAFCNVGSQDDGMYGLGIPSEVESFAANPLSRDVFGPRTEER